MGDIAIQDTALQSFNQITGDTKTVGLRSSKYSPQEWVSHFKSRFGQAENDCEQSERVINSTSALTSKLQAESTKRLKERFHDILFWKQELEREINDIIHETSILINEKNRLQSFLIETDVPLQIASENLNTREYRRGIDKVMDPVETELHAYSSFLPRQNRAVKETLEINWSDKKEADEIDAKAGSLKNCSTNKQFYAGVALYQVTKKVIYLALQKFKL
ncbi:unnamed protein product [Trichobilharzia regenti]|nr:unnamed protein product [Trichobilharzia regenti]